MSKKTNSFLPERIEKQISSFLDYLEAYNSKLPPERQRSSEGYAFLRYFFPAFVSDRNKRADEVNSLENKTIIKFGEEKLPMTTLSVMCMDGRVKMIHVFGFSAGIGSSLRVPGGLLKEFIRGKDGQLMLEEDSNFAQLVNSAVVKNKYLAEVFDSHWGCAARKAEESARGGFPEDLGLFSDVLHKREMVGATKKFILKKHGDINQITLIQTTFNPITGYLYMGLETSSALEFAKKFAEKKATAPVFSKPVIKALINDGLIISTGHLISNQSLRKILNKHLFEISWKKNYLKTAKNFWKDIGLMKDEVFPILTRSLISIYPELASADKNTQRELEERAMLLLCNTYNAYLHNHDHNEIEYLGEDDREYEKKEHYEYDEHIEEGIKVSEGGYPPYEIPMFVIFSGDRKNMPGNIELASGIVRDNRLKEHVKDKSESYKNPSDFARAPVPVVMQEIIRDQRLTKDDWAALENIDWSDLTELDWDMMSAKEFADYIEKKGKLSIAIANGLERLRQNMITVFDRDALTAAHLIDQFKVVLPVVCDQDRETHAIVPFIKLGY